MTFASPGCHNPRLGTGMSPTFFTVYLSVSLAITLISLPVSCFKFHAFYEYIVCLSHVSCILGVSCLPVSCFMFNAFYEYLVCLSHASCFKHSTSILSACLMFHAFYGYLVCLSHVSCFMHSTSILSACLMFHVSCILRVSCLSDLLLNSHYNGLSL